MKYVIDFPEDIELALEERASATGDDVVHLIQMAVVTFVRSDPQLSQVRRRPDLPVNTVEIVAPCDLPRTASKLISIQQAKSRHVDPIMDPA